MTDSLIVTAYNRPESLRRCLDSIRVCNLKDVDVFVSHDARGPKMDTAEFRCIEQQECVQPEDNIHLALQLAQDSELIMFVEDDFVVEPGFVDWHREIHKQFAPHISCADNSYLKNSDDPSDIMLSHSHCHVHAGAMSGASIQKLLDEESWSCHFEGVTQKYLIKNKLLAIHALMPRAHDTGVAGINIAEHKTNFILQNPITPSTFRVAIDRRDKWERDYKAQEQWGF
jgi:hypothetical protein